MEDSLCRELHLLLRLKGNDNADEISSLIETGQFEKLLQSEEPQQILGKKLEEAGEESWEINAESLAGNLQNNIVNYLNGSTNDTRRSREFMVLACGISCLQLYRQNNWVGPPTSFDAYLLLPKCFQEKEKRKELEASVLDWLSLDGEPVYGLSLHPLYLMLATVVLIECQDDLSHCVTLPIWQLRCQNTRQVLLEERSPTLKSSILEIIDEVLKNENLLANRPAMLQFYTETIKCTFFYYEPKMSHQLMDKAKKILDLEIGLTGAMGKRTRFQQNEIAQLLLKVSRKTKVNDSHDPSANSKEVSKVATTESLPKDLSLDDDTVLNKVEFSESQSDASNVHLIPEEQAFILLLGAEHHRSHESIGEIEQEESMSYITHVLSKPQDWCVQTMALLQRTLWESGSVRRSDRSMSQLEELVNQFEHPSKNPAERLWQVYSTHLPPRWIIQKHLGDFLRKVGAVSAALDLYLRLELWEEVISCYKQQGRIEKAEKVIRQQLQHSETPSLWCHLGDVLQDPECFVKAWELSSGRFSKAQRALGYYYLMRQQYEDCLPCFEKSLTLNPLQIGVWFSYGCGALACEKFDVAAKCFRRCVTIDTDNFEAWNNLANAYIKTNQKARAFTALQEALKCDYENWRIWENLLYVAVDIGRFEEAIRAFHRMLDIKDKYTDSEVLGILVNAVNSGTIDINGKSAELLRHKLRELMGHITSNVTTDSETWRLYADLLIKNPNNVTNEDTEKALHYLQKSHRCVIQTAGWEKEIASCEKVADKASQIAKVYLTSVIDLEPTRAVQLLSSARLMLKGTLAKVKQKHTDPVSQTLHGDLQRVCVELESDLDKITQAIGEKNSS